MPKLRLTGASEFLPKCLMAVASSSRQLLNRHGNPDLQWSHSGKENAVHGTIIPPRSNFNGR